MVFWPKRNLKTSGKSNEPCCKLQIEDLIISLYKKDVKGLRLSVRPNGEVRLSVPSFFSENKAKDFAESKLPWIRKHLNRIHQQKEQEPDDFSSVLYLGASYRTQVEYHPIAPRVVVDSPQTIKFYLKPGATSLQKGKTLETWYKAELKKIIPPLVKEWEPIMKVNVRSIQFKRMKTRWGTCNVSDHRLWFNVDLAKKTFPCIEYIVVHEMCHLLEHGHGPKFKACMDKFLPHWRDLKKELNGL